MFIQVAVGIGADKLFTYSCPRHLTEKALPGQRVIVPLGRKICTGFIIGAAQKDPDFEIKEAIDIPDETPLIPTELLKIAQWVSAYYRAPLGQALSVALPPGLEEGRPARPRKGVSEEAGPAWGAAPPRPSGAQSDAVREISRAALDGVFRTFLLHGVTGSGKTEVYIRCIEALKSAGKGAVVLVPEISLTPQLVGRFHARFGDSVAVLHSGLTGPQRLQQWRRIRSGEALIAVGARSAVFAPFTRLGMVVVDEEHDGSYKQEDGVRYNARDVAVMRGKLSGCPVVLGSATPSVESYHNAQAGRYTLLSLPERAGGRAMPRVRLIDLKDHPDCAALSPPLVAAAREQLAAGRQVLFFLNRRGWSNFLLCPDCGHVVSCPNCSIALTYHKGELMLKCHWCGGGYTPPDLCPKCSGHRFKHIGGGTERLQREIERTFEGARTTRIDRDTARGRGAYARLLGEVMSRETDVLLGTQMVAKGHDLPGIGLVGVVMADYGLGAPDFRASERVFQLVTQAAGRAGRGDEPGEVLVQTYQPEHYCLAFAARQDYEGFYAEEIGFRRELGYPPFSRLALVTVKGIKPEKAKAGAAAAHRAFKAAAGGSSVSVVGPAPAPLKRLRGKYRYFIVLGSGSSARLHAVLDEGMRRLRNLKTLSGCSVDVDIDPQSMV